jgi:hypothetical protein
VELSTTWPVRKSPPLPLVAFTPSIHRLSNQLLAHASEVWMETVPETVEPAAGAVIVMQSTRIVSEAEPSSLAPPVLLDEL